MHDGYGPFIIGQTTANSSEHRHDGRTVSDGEGAAGRRDQGENDSRKLINYVNHCLEINIYHPEGGE